MKAQVISFRCVLKNVVGQVISCTYNRDVLTQDAHAGSGALPGLAKGLTEVSPGEKRVITLKASEAYGLYNPELFTTMSLKKMANAGEVNIGDRVHLRGPQGKFYFYTITHILGDAVSLDANHPLAGQDLVFDIEVLEAREATDEDMGEQGPIKSTRHIH